MVANKCHSGLSTHFEQPSRGIGDPQGDQRLVAAFAQRQQESALDQGKSLDAMRLHNCFVRRSTSINGRMRTRKTTVMALAALVDLVEMAISTSAAY
jgi:hypothetical protein